MDKVGSRSQITGIQNIFTHFTLLVQLFELGPDGGDHETDGDLLAETDVLAYDCAARYYLSLSLLYLPKEK